MRKEPSGIRGTTFEFSYDSEEIEAIGAGPALGMALMEAVGIPDFIDSQTEWDRDQRVLSPGQACKAICGTMFTENIKRSLTKVQGFYSYAPVDSLFGEYVDHTSLNDVSLGRAMDTIYDADVERLFFNISARVKAAYQILSRFYHFDATNVTIARGPEDEYDVDEGVPIPKLGKPKDNTTGRVQYNLQAVVDDNGFPVYQKVHDGNRADCAMDMDALDFLGDVMADERIIAVADCKIVNEDAVNRLIWSNIPFVSKCPDNFGCKAKASVIDEACANGFGYVGRIGKRNDAPEYEAYDTYMTANGERLRFVAYREVGVKHSLNFYTKNVAKTVDSMISAVMKKDFACEKDAMLEVKRLMRRMRDRPFDLHVTTECNTVRMKRSRRGRPMKGEAPPETVEVWKLVVTKTFDESRATEMAKRRDVRAIITSVPYAERTCDCVADGCSTRDILAIYMNQWRVENIFGEMKSKLGADKVFFESPKRETVMLFLISLAVLIRRLMQHLLRAEYGKGFGIPRNITAYGAFSMIQNTSVRMDRISRRIYLDGPQEEKQAVRDFARILNIDPVRLVG